MNPKAATAPMELAPDPVLASDALFVVGITSEGGVPLLVDSRRDYDVDRFVEGHDGAEGHEVVRLPGLIGSRPLDPLSTLHRRLQDETGLDAPELVVMSRYGIPTGARGRATILLAPHARVTAPAKAGDAVPDRVREEFAVSERSGASVGLAEGRLVVDRMSPSRAARVSSRRPSAMPTNDSSRANPSA